MIHWRSTFVVVSGLQFSCVERNPLEVEWTEAGEK